MVFRTSHSLEWCFAPSIPLTTHPSTLPDVSPSSLRTYPPTPGAVRLPPPLHPTGAVFHLPPWMGTVSSARRRASPTPTPDTLLPHRASSARYRSSSTPTGTVCHYLTSAMSHDLLLTDDASTSPLPEDMLCAPVAVDGGHGPSSPPIELSTSSPPIIPCSDSQLPHH